MCVCGVAGLVYKSSPILVIPWIVAHQAPLSRGFSRQAYWSGLPLPSPGNLFHPGIKPRSPAWQVDSLLLSYQGSLYKYIKTYTYIHTYIQWNITQPPKSKEILPFAIMWMDLDIIMLSEQVREYCMLALICGI